MGKDTLEKPIEDNRIIRGDVDSKTLKERKELQKGLPKIVKDLFKVLGIPFQDADKK